MLRGCSEGAPRVLRGCSEGAPRVVFNAGLKEEGVGRRAGSTAGVHEDFGFCEWRVGRRRGKLAVFERFFSIPAVVFFA